jgi:hypothetical protein
MLYDMIYVMIYDMIYLFTENGFPPGGSRRQSCEKIGQRQLYTKEETIHKTMQNRTILKIEKTTYKQDNKC